MGRTLLHVRLQDNQLPRPCQRAGAPSSALQSVRPKHLLKGQIKQFHRSDRRRHGETQRTYTRFTVTNTKVPRVCSGIDFLFRESGPLALISPLALFTTWDAWCTAKAELSLLGAASTLVQPAQFETMFVSLLPKVLQTIRRSVAPLSSRWG